MSERACILVVEDSRTQAAELTFHLQDAGFDVQHVSDGMAALEALRGGNPRPSMIVSDVVMPGLSGYELCRAVKQDPRLRHLPVLLLTSLRDPREVMQALQGGADGFATKPYDPPRLIERIRTLLHSRSLRRTSDAVASSPIDISFLGEHVQVSSPREQVLDLLVSTFEDAVRTNGALEESRRHLAEAKAQIETYARRLESRVEISEQKYGRLLAQARDAIVLLDPGGLIVEVNRAACDLFNATEQELAGRSLATFLADQPEDLQALLGGTHRGELPLRVLGRNGAGEVWVEATSTPVEATPERVVLVILRDVTERRKIELERARLYAEARRQITLRDEFLTAASHELRTPLVPLKLQLEILTRAQAREAQKGEGGTCASLGARLETMKRLTARLESLVEELLLVSELSTTGVADVRYEPGDLAQLVRASVLQFRETSADETPIQIQTPAAVPGEWDRRHVHQVLCSLLSNAVKFGLQQPIQVRLEAGPTHARLEVRDHGVGISEADRARVFERFERAAPIAHFGGFGLGLWLVRELTRAMGGTVQVESALGQGSRFILELPRRSPPAELHSAPGP